MRCNDFESFDPLNDSCLLGENGREDIRKTRLVRSSFRIEHEVIESLAAEINGISLSSLVNRISRDYVFW
jgi:hypothetical protein